MTNIYPRKQFAYYIIPSRKVAWEMEIQAFFFPKVSIFVCKNPVAGLPEVNLDFMDLSLIDFNSFMLSSGKRKWIINGSKIRICYELEYPL